MAVEIEENVANKKHFEDKVNEYLHQGFELKVRTESFAELRKTDFGKWWVHLLLLFIAPFIGNVLYAVYSKVFRYNKRVVVRLR